MTTLTPNQRQAIYRKAAERAGIHHPILAALHQTHGNPKLDQGETGLGISPAHLIPLAQVSTFVNQVEIAANTIRCLTNQLTVTGWKGKELWDIAKGRYTTSFLQAIADGFLAPASDPTSARLEACDGEVLTQTYQQLCDSLAVPADQSFLQEALPQFVRQVPNHYFSLPYQQAALLEAARIWQKQDTTAAAIAQLVPDSPAIDRFELDQALLQALYTWLETNADYPHHWQALLALVQRWRRLTSQEAAIADLQGDSSPAFDLANLDPALLAMVQRIPQHYLRSSEQRAALLEGFQQWQQFPNRADATIALGVNPAILTSRSPSSEELVAAAALIDRALLDFYRQLPLAYRGQPQQRQALLHLAERWYGVADQEQARWALAADLTQLATDHHRAVTIPVPSLTLPTDGFPKWTPDNLQLFAPIVPRGDCLWVDATRGGVFLPPNQATVDQIVEMATAIQLVRDRLHQPITIVCWYCPVGEDLGGDTADRFALGDAIAFYSLGYTAQQLYWLLDPWWRGGLGYYAQFPYLCIVDIRHPYARWQPQES
jgi:hypothetical protein